MLCVVLCFAFCMLRFVCCVFNCCFVVFRVSCHFCMLLVVSVSFYAWCFWGGSLFLCLCDVVLCCFASNCCSCCTSHFCVLRLCVVFWVYHVACCVVLCCVLCFVLLGLSAEY